MVIKKSRFGPFLGCSGYPECSNTRRIGKDGKPVPLPLPTGVACPKCTEGELMQRRGKFGRPFFGCSRYPKCDYITNSLDELAPVVVDGAVAQAPINAVAKAPAKPTAKAPAKPTTKAPAKPTTKAPAKSTAKVPTKSTAKTPTKPAATTAKRTTKKSA
jgi:DNA topoisomerase-1